MTLGETGCLVCFGAGFVGFVFDFGGEARGTGWAYGAGLVFDPDCLKSVGFVVF